LPINEYIIVLEMADASFKNEYKHILVLNTKDKHNPTCSNEPIDE